MKKILLLVVTLLFSSQFIKAQISASGSYSEFFREGNFLLQEENYDMALRNFLEAYKRDSSSANINFNVGFCYLNSSNKKGLAESYLAKAITNITKNYNIDEPSEKGAPALALFYYGRALHINYKFDEAALQYDLFKNQYAKTKDLKEEIAYYRAQTDYAKELVAVPLNVKIDNLGDSINSEYPDFSPVLSADERMMIYTTRRNTSTGGEKTPEGQYFEDVVISYKDDKGNWSSPVSVSDYINTNGHEASANITPDGQTLIIYRDDNGNGNIYYSTWDGKTWSGLSGLGSDINSKYWETHGCLNNDQSILYFVSDRPGGYGGRDIYRCRKLPNGKWGLAQNLGATVNTKYDEDAVFIHPSGDLIFASKGHRSMGGFDIFVSTPDEEGKFTEPMNMRYPINTPDDDVFFVTSPDGKRGYFSSANDKGFGEKDIYMMSIPGAKEKPLALFKGSIIPAPGEKLPDDLVIIVTDKETGEIIGTYKPKANGTFATILPPDRHYNFSYTSKGEEFYNEDLYVTNDVAYQEIKKEINLEPVNLMGVRVREKKALLNTIVFNNPKDKQPVANAKVYLTEVTSSNTKNFTTNSKGKKDSILLSFDKKYEIYAEANGKKSAINSFDTEKIKGSKSITQIMYLDGSPKTTNDLILNLVAVDSKKQPLKNARITITGNEGVVYEGNTDAKGSIKGIGLNKDNNYSIVAETENGVQSEKLLYTTLNAKPGSEINKKLSFKFNVNKANTVANYGCGTPTKFKQNFGYDKNDIDEAQDWNNLIDAIVAKTKDCSPVVKILSSASQVTTYSFKDNRALSTSRAEKMVSKIKAAVTAKGGDANKIEFVKIAKVRGPKYEGDYLNKAKYEPYQYVKVIAK